VIDVTKEASVCSRKDSIVTEIWLEYQL